MSIVLDIQSQSNWIISTTFNSDLRLEPIFYYSLIKESKANASYEIKWNLKQAFS